MNKVILFIPLVTFILASAVLADQKQDKEAIINELSVYADKEPSVLSGVVFSIGDAYIRENKIEEAIALYEKAANILSYNEDILNRLANLYNKKADYDKVIAVYKKLISLKPDNVWYAQMLSNSLNMAGRKDEASDIWKVFIAKRPEDPDALNQAANFYGNLNDMEKAVPLAEKAVKLDANNAGYAQNLSNLYKRAGKFDKAEEACRKILNSAKDQWLRDWANGEILSIYQKQDKLDDLAARSEAGLLKNPENADLLKLLGELYLRKGENDKALSRYEKAVSVSPDDRNVNNRLADLYESQGKITEAISQVEKIVKIAPSEFYLFERLANLYDKAGRKEDAKKAWGSAASGISNDVNFYLRYAETLYKFGDFDKARAAFEKVSADAKEEWMKAEAKKRLEEIAKIKIEPVKKAVTKEEKPKQKEPKKKKGLFGR